MSTDSEHDHDQSLPVEDGETSSPIELLGEIRETLAQEDEGKAKTGHGLFAWLKGFFKRKEPAVPEEPRLPVASPQPEVEPEEDEITEMMGAFPVYLPEGLRYYELEETDEPESENAFEPTGPVNHEMVGVEEAAAFETPTIEESESTEPVERNGGETGAVAEDSSEWKNLLAKLLKKQDKENAPDLDDAGLEERLQRSMGERTAEGLEAWLASLHEQEKSAGEAGEPDLAQEWSDETRFDLQTRDELSGLGSQMNYLQEEPSESESTRVTAPLRHPEHEGEALVDERAVASEDLSTDRTKDLRLPPSESESTRKTAVLRRPENNDETPIEGRLVTFKDPSTDRTKDLRLPSDDYATRLSLAEEYKTAYAEEEMEIPPSPPAPLHPEIFMPGEEEKSSQAADLRNVALEDYEAPSSTGEVINPERPETALERFATRISDRSRQQQILIYVMIIIIFMGIVLSVALALRSLFPAMTSPSTAPVTMSVTAAPGSAPYPMRLILTGGWPFDLNRGAVQNGRWDPQGSEWLEGTELRRVVGLRYNPQLEAVANSLKKGDEISLVMSNADTLLYKVEEIKTVPVDDTSIFMGTRPSLLIVLFDQKAGERRVILCGQ